MLSQDKKREFVIKLAAIEAVRFGKFKFKSGIISPIYMDLRLFVSYPRFLKEIANMYADSLITVNYDRLAGIPYGALPITAALASEVNKPWIFPRKEIKDYGTQKAIEGKFEKGEKIVIVDDLITKGDSKLEALIPLKKAGLSVKDIIVLIDYEKGGSQLLKKKGYNLISIITMSEVIEILLSEKIISQSMHKKLVDFLGSD